jgi:hypothetical protein
VKSEKPRKGTLKLASLYPFLGRKNLVGVHVLERDLRLLSMGTSKLQAKDVSFHGFSFCGKCNFIPLSKRESYR